MEAEQAEGRGLGMREGGRLVGRGGGWGLKVEMGEGNGYARAKEITTKHIPKSVAGKGDETEDKKPTWRRSILFVRRINVKG